MVDAFATPPDAGAQLCRSGHSGQLCVSQKPPLESPASTPFECAFVRPADVLGELHVVDGLNAHGGSSFHSTRAVVERALDACASVKSSAEPPNAFSFEKGKPRFGDDAGDAPSKYESREHTGRVLSVQPGAFDTKNHSTDAPRLFRQLRPAPATSHTAAKTSHSTTITSPS